MSDGRFVLRDGRFIGIAIRFVLLDDRIIGRADRIIGRDDRCNGSDARFCGDGVPFIASEGRIVVPTFRVIGIAGCSMRGDAPFIRNRPCFTRNARRTVRLVATINGRATRSEDGAHTSGASPLSTRSCQSSISIPPGPRLKSYPCGPGTSRWSCATPASASAAWRDSMVSR